MKHLQHRGVALPSVFAPEKLHSFALAVFAVAYFLAVWFHDLSAPIPLSHSVNRSGAMQRLSHFEGIPRPSFLMFSLTLDSFASLPPPALLHPTTPDHSHHNIRSTLKRAKPRHAHCLTFLRPPRLSPNSPQNVAFILAGGTLGYQGL